MDFFQHRYYKTNKILLTIIGQWPYQTTCSSFGLSILCAFLGVIQGCPQILAIIQYRNDWELLLKCASPFFFLAICTTEFFCSVCNSSKLSKMLNRMREDWQVWSEDPEVKVLHEYAERGRKMTITYAVYIYLTGILFVTQPVIPKIIGIFSSNNSKPGEFPIPVDYYHLDMQKYYFHIIICTYISTSAGLIVTIASDVMFMVCVQHACGLFAALGQKLEHIGKHKLSPRNEKIGHLTRDIDFENLVTCIDRHNDAIEYAELLEAHYSWCLFFIVGFNVLMITMIGLQIVTRENGLEGTTRFIAWLISDTIYLFIKTYMAQILMDHSINIRNCIQNGKWFRLPLKTQKLLNFMMMRCNLPCKLTAGKIAIMSVETFKGTSITYLTFLRSMS